MRLDSSLLQYFPQLLPQIPVLLVSIAGIICMRLRRPAGAAWAMLGFSLTGFLSLVTPVVQVLAVSWIQAEGVSRGTWIFSVIGLVTTALHAASLGLLLAALLASPRSLAGEPLPPR